MKKIGIILGSLATLALVVFVGLPGVLGSQVNERLFEIIDQEAFGTYVDLELIDFDEGWFTSKARMSVKPAGILGAASGLSGEQTMTFDVELSHGPVLFGNGFGLGLARFVNESELPMPRSPRSGGVTGVRVRYLAGCQATDYG